ncbi:hypothetical protein BO71DRAFT_75818 [Aspergillus ellipticus CBS 707.79]|uniref:Uncharacterized protein n=1 Tax=Aspergillus ellipticus CBS 707.79 TaxID=1448320 RepID=A0A319D0B5_9EURO|nr:hypothetical protein BO71DRAFT_75818 [Aspergillus ellipticus CBS 707.79]
MPPQTNKLPPPSPSFIATLRTHPQTPRTRRPDRPVLPVRHPPLPHHPRHHPLPPRSPITPHICIHPPLRFHRALDECVAGCGVMYNSSALTCLFL